VITHYQRLLDYIVPDRIHVLGQGPHRAEGGKELALELEAKGYGNCEGAGMTLALNLDRKAEAATWCIAMGAASPDREMEIFRP